MRQKTISFKVDDQFIQAPCYRVVADSQNYLCARFSFSDCWQGLTKTAVFTGADGATYHMLLDEDACLVPAEVIKPTRFLVSVFGGDRLTTDYAVVEVEASGCVDGVTPPVPTPDIYTQFVDAVNTERQLAQAAAVAAGEKAEQCGNAAMLAMDAEERAMSARNEAFFYASEAQEVEKTVQEAAEAASACATEAAQHADTVSAEAVAVAESAERAQEAERKAHNHKLQCEQMVGAATDCAWNAEFHAQAAKQSADAAAEAAASIPKTEWELLEDFTLTEEVLQVNIPSAKLQGLKELHISAYIVPTDTTVTSQDVLFGISGKTYWTGKANPKATGTLKAVMDVSISPRGTVIFDGTVSAHDYTLTGTSYKGLGYFRTADMNDEGFDHLGSAQADFWMRTTAANLLAAGTRVKVWGR